MGTRVRDGKKSYHLQAGASAVGISSQSPHRTWLPVLAVIWGYQEVPWEELDPDYL